MAVALATCCLLALIDGIALIYLAGDVDDAFAAAMWMSARLAPQGDATP